MSDALQLEIVTPSGLALSREVLEVEAPTLDGAIGVLPGHLPLLAAVRTGLVQLKPRGEEPLQFAVAHGVFEVAGSKALLLAERFMRKEDVDIVTVRARFKEVGDELQAWSGDLDDPRRIELIEEEQWLAAQLELIGDPPPPTVREATRFQPKALKPEVLSEAGLSDEASGSADTTEPSEG
jgi:F-type H+-transporting ATPase subunit epsilon